MRVGSRIAIVGLLAGVAAISGHEQQIAPTLVADDGELVLNGGFENSLAGWRVNDAKATSLSRGGPGQTGDFAATILSKRAGSIALNDSVNTVASTQEGTSYEVSAYVRSTLAGVLAQLRVREVNGGTLAYYGGKVARLNAQWQKVSMTYRSTSSGGSLDLNLVGWGVPAGQAIQVDDISMRVSPTSLPPIVTPVGDPPPVVGPTAAAPGSSAGAPATGTGTGTGVGGGTTAGGGTVPTSGKAISGCINARGIPNCGAFFGAAIGGNADPAADEAKYGATLALRRTYYQSTQVAGALRTVKSDLALGRLPWISFKLPYSWTDMANGKGDAWATDLAKQLSAVDGPVWVAFHHEPEGDGDMQEWTRMQAHLSPIVRSNASNVAFTIVTTGWNQVFGNTPSYQLEALWPGDGLVDIVGFDAYNQYGVVKNGTTITKSTELKDYYVKLAAFSAKHNTNWAIGETGYTDAAAAKDPAWLTRAYSDMVSMGGVGLAYFDSSLNSIGSWPLESPAKVNAFSTALSKTLRLP